MTGYAFLTRIRSTSEGAVRGRAVRLGYTVSKSRDRALHSNNAGLFHLCDDRNNVILGDGFSASLEDISSYLAAVIHMSDLQPKGTA